MTKGVSACDREVLWIPSIIRTKFRPASGRQESNCKNPSDVTNTDQYAAYTTKVQDSLERLHL